VGALKYNSELLYGKAEEQIITILDIIHGPDFYLKQNLT
jgi:hypothetical protein